MIAGIQYCGGCNPCFDRTAFVQKLQKDFPALEIFYFGFGEEKPADISIVIAGCSCKCTASETPEGKFAKFVVAKSEDYASLACTIRAYST